MSLWVSSRVAGRKSDVYEEIRRVAFNAFASAGFVIDFEIGM